MKNLAIFRAAVSFCVVHAAFLIQNCAASTMPYLEVEYIEGTGTQWINTGYIPSPTTRTVVDFQFTVPTKQYRVFGLECGNLYYSLCENGSGNWTYSFHKYSGSWNQISPATACDANRHLIDFNFLNAGGQHCLVIDGGAVASVTGLTGTQDRKASYTLALGAARTAAETIANISKHRIFSCKMYEGNALVRDYVPCLRQGVAGLLDRVNGVFYASAGSGAYLASSAPEDAALEVRLSSWKVGATPSATGLLEGYSAGDTVSLSCPAVWTNAAGTVSAACTGWKVYDYDGNLVDSGSSLSVDYAFPSAYRQFVWQWDVSYKITTAAAAGGTAAPAEQWVADGATATVTATPNAGVAFYRWTNDVPASVAPTSATMSFPATGPASLFATFGNIWYVSPTGDGSAPAAGFATGYATIAGAVAAAQNGDTILLDAATHTLSGCVTLGKALKIIGQGVGHTFVTTTATADRHFLVQNADAILDGIEFVGKKITQRSLVGWVVSVTAGTIRDCRIAGFTQGSYFQSGVLHLNGASARAERCVIANNANNHSSDAISACAGLYCENGTVTDCVITGNDSFQASGLWLKAGLVADTLVADNRIIYPDRSDKSLGTGAGAYVEGGTLRRCTIIANKSTIYSGVGVHVAGTTARFEDCTIRYSESPGVNATVWPDINCANPAVEANFSGCRLAAPFGVNSDTNCPFFANLAQGDYTPVEAFTANRVTALQGEAITFTSRIAGDAEWTFTGAGGNATTASGNPVSPVLAPGTYDVALAVGGATYTAAGAVKIGPASVSPATGADLLAAVATATDGTVIHLAADQYEITDTILLACRATIVGAGRDDTVLKMKSSANKRVVVLAHPDAVVSNLTLSGGRCNVYGPTRGISLWINKRGGRFTHGRVTASTTKSHYQYGAVGVSASSGYVGNCVIDGNYNIYQKNSGSSTGGGAYIEAGLMENCLISDNDAFYGAGFVIAGSGRVRNCTVVGNRAYKTGGGVYWNNGGQEVVNCVFMGNTAEADTTLGAPNWAPDTATAARYTAISNAFHACAFVGSVAASADSFVMNDPFLAYASGDYHPAAGTAGLVDKGQSYANPAATDLDGNARVQGGGIDIGCYEREALSTSVSFTAATVEAFSDTAVAFASEIVNPAPGITYGYNWSFTDRNGNAFSSSVSNPVVTLPAGWYTVALSIYDTANPSAVVESGARPDYLRLALRDIYLVPENPSAAFPYGSWATAGTNLFEALEWSMDGTAIHLGEGTFPTTNELIVAADVAISGRGWDKTTILLGPKAPNRRVATINSPGAVVEGVTLTGGRSDLNYGEHTTVGTGVLIGVLGGTLRNSRVTGNVSKHHYQHGAVAVIGASGLVDGCLIDGNRNTHREVSSHGGGLYLTKGEARNCVVTNNISNIGGGVSLDGGKIRNCTVAFNHAVHCTTKTINSNPPNYVGGYGGDFATKDGGGTAINCVFFGGDETPWDVSGQQSAETVVKEWVGNANASVTLRNCAFPSARGLPTGFKTLTATDCVLFGDPGFRSVGRGNVAIRASSPLRDAGSNAFAWPAPATDFAGNPRVAGKGVDIGAFECQAGPASVIFLQ